MVAFMPKLYRTHFAQVNHPSRKHEDSIGSITGTLLDEDNGRKDRRALFGVSVNLFW
jgi:hypothetical protein